MNERIKQLAEQAGCKVMDDGEWYIPSATGLEKIVYTKGIGLEKFAELIVRECVGICKGKTDHLDPNMYEVWRGALACASDIKVHFGVEE